MSYSLLISDGDLALNGNAFAKVAGAGKLEQDLRCYILTPESFYEAFPELGTDIESIVGTSDPKKGSTLLRGEIQRVCTEYQERQIFRNRSDQVRYGRLTITPDETLLRVDSIDIIQVENFMIAKVKIEIGRGTVELNLPVGA